MDKEEKGLKFDGIDGGEMKLRYDLMPPHALEGVVKVITYGAKKYAPNNWKYVSKDRYIAAAYRHLEAYRKGEYLDEESKLEHIYHAMTCLTFISELDIFEGKKQEEYFSRAAVSKSNVEKSSTGHGELHIYTPISERKEESKK